MAACRARPQALLFKRALRPPGRIQVCAASTARRDAFKAYIVDVDKDGNLSQSGVRWLENIADLPRKDPEADALVRVHYSTLNYKDGMIVRGRPGVVTPPGRFPIVPGIDAAGEVLECKSGDFAPGDKVVITGNKIGQHFDGGFSQRLCVKSGWLARLPDCMTLEESMAIGSAGVTAMQCIMHLEEAAGLSPEKGEVLVTGAGGGVGSVAVAVLARLGYRVVGATRRAEQLGDYLRDLGAARVIDKLDHDERRPLGKQLWAGAVDTVGGSTLAAVVAQTKYRCGVASTGVAGDSSFNSTVYPFILRGVRLLGVDSTLPYKVAGWPDDEASRAAYADERRRIWARLATDLPRDALRRIHGGVIGLSDVEEWSQRILVGGVRGRVVVDLSR